LVKGKLIFDIDKKIFIISSNSLIVKKHLQNFCEEFKKAPLSHTFSVSYRYCSGT